MIHKLETTISLQGNKYLKYVNEQWGMKLKGIKISTIIGEGRRHSEIYAPDEHCLAYDEKIDEIDGHRTEHIAIKYHTNLVNQLLDFSPGDQFRLKSEVPFPFNKTFKDSNDNVVSWQKVGVRTTVYDMGRYSEAYALLSEKDEHNLIPEQRLQGILIGDTKVNSAIDYHLDVAVWLFDLSIGNRFQIGAYSSLPL